MLGIIPSFLVAIGVLFRSRSDTALQVLALRQQVAVLKRKRPRPKLNSLDRLFWTAPEGGETLRRHRECVDAGAALEALRRRGQGRARLLVRGDCALYGSDGRFRCCASRASNVADVEAAKGRLAAAMTLRCRSAFRGDGDRDSELMPIAIPR